MDDSSMFIQWAMETMQHDGLGGGDAFPSLQQLRCSELQNGRAHAEAAAHAADNRWSSEDSGRENTPGGAAVEKDAWSSNCSVVGTTTYPPVGWNFTSTMAQPGIDDDARPTAPAGVHQVAEMEHRSPASRKRSSTGAGNTSPELEPEPCVQEHVMAERKRREKINRRFIELSTVIPGLKKLDKATILSDAVRHVKEQQERIKVLEDRNVRSIDSARPCIATKPDGATTTARSSLPEIEARISESNVMVRIHCEDGKGVLVRVLTEVEDLELSITHTNVMPFPDCTVNITIMAKVDEGFNVAAEDIVGKLDAALHRRHSAK